MGTSDEWSSSAVTMRGSTNATVVAAGALTVSTVSMYTCTANFMLWRNVAFLGQIYWHRL